MDQAIGHWKKKRNFIFLGFHMGGCQNYGPLLDPYDNDPYRDQGRWALGFGSYPTSHAQS